MSNMIIFLFSGVIIIGIILLVVMATTRRSPKGLSQEEYRCKWLKITSAIDDGEPSRHLAILNADKLLDKALKARGFKGETMGERLNSSKAQLTQRNNIWSAHKLRNRVAHEDNIVISKQELDKSMSAFKQALKDIGAL